VAGRRFAGLERVEIGQAIIEYRLEKVEVDVDVAADHFAVPKDVAEKLSSGKAAPKEMGDRQPRIVPTQARSTLTIRGRMKPDQIGRKIATALPKICMYLAEQKVEALGPPFSRYHAIGGDLVDIEVGYFVPDGVEGRDSIKAGRLPALKAAMLFHKGPYSKLRETYKKLEKWIEDKGLTRGEAPWETYWVSPDMVKDESELRTQVFMPIR